MKPRTLQLAVEHDAVEADFRRAPLDKLGEAIKLTCPPLRLPRLPCAQPEPALDRLAIDPELARNPLDTLRRVLARDHHVGIAGSSRQGWEPVEPRKDAVLDRARLDVAGPADSRRHPKATLADRTSRSSSWFCACAPQLLAAAGLDWLPAPNDTRRWSSPLAQ